MCRRSRSHRFLNPGYGAGFTTANPTGAVSVPYASPSLAARPPYYINWSFGLQRQFGDSWTVGATYSASVGHFLPRNGDNGIWTNSMLPQYLVLGSLLGVQATPANLAAAQAIVPGIALPFSNFQGTIAQMLKPFPQYSGVTYYSGNLGNSTYNSLQVTLERRFAKGFTTQTGYTFSKEIDNSIGAGTNLGAVGGNRNPYDGSLDKALGAIDRRHIFHATFLYALPFGKGYSVGSGNAVVRRLWSAAGRFPGSSRSLRERRSPLPVPAVIRRVLPPLASRVTTPRLAGRCRINGDFGSGNALAPGAVSYYDKRVFADPARLHLRQPAAIGSLRPVRALTCWMNPSVCGGKSPSGERWKLAITADVFNVTNSVHFAAPGTNIDSANFGQVTTTTNLPAQDSIECADHLLELQTRHEV